MRQQIIHATVPLPMIILGEVVQSVLWHQATTFDPPHEFDVATSFGIGL